MAALARYQAFGVNGVAFPERLVRDWVGEGVLLYRQGRELVEMGLSARPGWHYLKGDPALLALLPPPAAPPPHPPPQGRRPDVEHVST